jgi:restriction endonuclease Mrr
MRDRRESRHEGSAHDNVILLLRSAEEVSPQYFETIVLDLLHKMGYGTSRADLVRVWRAGDGGIDGVISLDRLGLEKVYVQAERWQNITVGIHQPSRSSQKTATLGSPAFL